jgi:hypothetical protein
LSKNENWIEEFQQTQIILSPRGAAKDGFVLMKLYKWA